LGQGEHQPDDKVRVLQVTADLPGETMSARKYRVQKGDTLSTIAKRELGDAGSWRGLYDRNRTAIGPDPDRISPGMRLELPEATGLNAEDLAWAQDLASGPVEEEVGKTEKLKPTQDLLQAIDEAAKFVRSPLPVKLVKVLLNPVVRNTMAKGGLYPTVLADASAALIGGKVHVLGATFLPDRVIFWETKGWGLGVWAVAQASLGFKYARLPDEGKEHVLRFGASAEIGPGLGLDLELVREVDENDRKGPTEVEAGASVGGFEITDEIVGDQKGAESVGGSAGFGAEVAVGAFLSLKTRHGGSLAYPEHAEQLQRWLP
jgi:hypothetical protein